MNRNKLLDPVIISPFLVAACPVIFLYAQNADRVPAAQIIRPLIVTMLFAFLLQRSLYMLVKNKIKASFMAGIVLFVCLYFGYLTAYIPNFEISLFHKVIIGKNLLLTSSALLLFIFLVSQIIKAKNNFKNGVIFMSIMASALISMNLLQVVFASAASLFNGPVTFLKEKNTLKTRLNYLPDVYYIILDMHARRDILAENYGYKDGLFIPELEDMGFYIATQSSANYPKTYESISSSLNLNYHDKLIKGTQPDTADFIPLVENNIVAQKFKSLGYKYILFNSGYAIDNISPLADYVYEYTLGLNRFEQLFLNNTIFSRVLQKLNLDINKFRRQRIMYFFSKLTEIPADQHPTFTYAHLMVPHWPFVFDREGNPVKQKSLSGIYDFPGSKTEYKKQYLDQLIYTDKKILEAVTDIISNSDRPPVIIIQSDHGPSSEIDWENIDGLSEEEKVYDPHNITSIKERSAILNAYFFPDENYEYLYSSISPVNSFRIIFNRFFGGKYDLLRDKFTGTN